MHYFNYIACSQSVNAETVQLCIYSPSMFLVINTIMWQRASTWNRKYTEIQDELTLNWQLQKHANSNLRKIFSTNSKVQWVGSHALCNAMRNKTQPSQHSTHIGGMAGQLTASASNQLGQYESSKPTTKYYLMPYFHVLHGLQSVQLTDATIDCKRCSGCNLFYAECVS